MKKRARFFVLLGGILLFVTVCWMLGSPRKAGRQVTLTLVSTATNNSPGPAIFRLKNDGADSIFLSEVFVEVKTSAGWQPSSQPTPSDPRTVSAGAAKDITVQPPGGSGAWRVRIAYGNEVRYPTLLFLKASLAVESRSWGPFSRLRPGDTWMGSNSLAGAELTP